jgi:ferredoxin
MPYHGEPTCAAANLVAGVQGCVYGCLGFGDCTRACKYDAIHVIDGLATVDYEKCIGCKACARACPRNIMGLTDVDEAVHVYCRSRDKGPFTKKNCSAGCIACKLCEKDDDTGAVKVVDNLSVIDHSVSKAPVAATKRCPTEVIRLAEPVPGYEYELPQTAESTAAGE